MNNLDAPVVVEPKMVWVLLNSSLGEYWTDFVKRYVGTKLYIWYELLMEKGWPWILGILLDNKILRNHNTDYAED